VLTQGDALSLVVGGDVLPLQGNDFVGRLPEDQDLCGRQPVLGGQFGVGEQKPELLGSTIEISATGDLIAIDPTGLEWQVPRERWLRITVGSDRGGYQPLARATTRQLNTRPNTMPPRPGPEAFHASTPNGSPLFESGYVPFDDPAGDVDELDVRVLRCPERQLESSFAGEAFAVHQDAFRLADVVSATQRVAHLRHASSAD